jgi:carboxypeptidase Q
MKKNFALLFIISLIFSFNSFAQRNNSVTDSIAQLIKNEEKSNSKVMEIASYLTDVYGPRLTFSNEYKQAAEWAVTKMKEWGLENVHFEKWGPVGKGWTLKSFYAEVIEPRTIPLIAYPTAWSPSLKGTVKGDVVWLNVSSEKDFDNYKGKLKGKFVLLSNETSLHPHFLSDARRLNDSTLLHLANAYQQTRQRRFRFPRFEMGNFDSVFALFKQFRPEIDSATVANFIIERTIGPKKLQFCMDEGAKAVLTISSGDDGTVFVQQATVPRKSGNQSERPLPVYDQKAPQVIPQIVVSAENYNRMIRMIEKGEKLTLQMELETEITKPDSALNIIGEIPGTDKKDEVVMIGGHFDSWQGGTGATDDACGSAVCMEALRIIKKLNLIPRRTIRIGLWAGEEEGLLGSRAYVDQHFGEKSIDYNSEATEDASTISPETKEESKNFSVYFNDDNGTGRFRGIYLQGNESARTIFQEWLSEFNDPTAQTISISNTGGTDHLSFDNAGLPGFQFIQDPLDYDSRTHHSNMDVYDRLQKDDLEQAAEMMAFFAYKAAIMENQFPRKEKE